jgi:hypothetical protein
VSWFEEPVSSDDLAGLHLLRNRAPAYMEIAAGVLPASLEWVRRCNPISGLSSFRKTKSAQFHLCVELRQLLGVINNPDM